MRAVLFDMDGVLVDSFETWLATLGAVAGELGTPPVSAAQLAAAFGQGIDEDARTFFRGQQPAVLRAAYQRHFPAHLERMRVNPRGLEVLRALGAQGIGRAVVTNTQPELAESILRICGLLEHVDTLSAAEPDVPEKPAPDMLERALARLGVAPGDALMVGDTEYDAQAAAAAGVRFLHYDLRAGQDLAEALATLGKR